MLMIIQNKSLEANIMNIAIKCALIEAGIMKPEAEELDIKELKTFMTSCERLHQRTVKGSRILSDQGNCYLVESIYHSCLTNAQKEEIYTSEYEIGNPNPIINLDIEDLYSYLEDEYGGSAEDLVKNIKRNITELVGLPFETFHKADKSLSYKIITLFYRVCRQFSNQFFNFLNVDKQRKMQFEFRATFPYGEAKGKGYENTALLAEVLGHLTFAMPKEYLEQARLIETYLPAIANEISKHTRKYIERTNNAVGRYEDSGQMVNLNEIVDGNLKSAFNSIFESTDNQLTQRLDFLLYNLISLKEYIARKSSNELLAKLVYETPLKLRPFQDRACKTWEDKHVIPYLLEHDKSVSDSVDKQADFIERYILERRMDGTVALPAQNKQILKAVIIHDSAIGIKIESSVFGGKNIPSSITAVLKKGARDLDRSKTNGTPFSYLDYPEAILLYWVMRYELALRIVMSKDKQEAINEFQRVANWEIRVDEALIAYVKKQT